jgi:hypothetical protein
MWGIDVIGNIMPKASNGHRFILVAIDYFTKWVEKKPMLMSPSEKTESALARSGFRASACFIQNNIIARYGRPSDMTSLLIMPPI